jgi:hypothetical protein
MPDLRLGELFRKRVLSWWTVGGGSSPSLVATFWVGTSRRIQMGLYRVKFKLGDVEVSSPMVVEGSSKVIVVRWCEAVVRDLDEVPDSYEVEAFSPFNVDQEVKVGSLYGDLGAEGG